MPTPNADPDEQARIDQDLKFQTLYAPPFYRGRQGGPGRWCILYAHGEQLGYLWTTDEGGLGFVATSQMGRQRTPEFAKAFSTAKAQGTPAGDVFDAYAERVGLGLSAGPTETGDVNTLPE